jgi:hypothetical protein
MTMRRLRLTTYAAGLVAGPLLFATYWVLYPAYGDLRGAELLADIGAAPGRTLLADAFAFPAVFLAVPGTLGYLRALDGRAPRLAGVGAAVSILGWMAVLPPLTLDLVARELRDDPARFDAIFTSPAVTVLNAVAGLHVVGAVLIGLALVRTRIVAQPLAVAATAAPRVHLGSNLAGLLWLDVAAWLVIAATGVAVLPGLARLVAADEAVPRRVEGGPGPRADADLGVDVLDVS